MTKFKSPSTLLCTAPVAESRQESSLSSCLGIPPALGNHNVLLEPLFPFNFGIEILTKVRAISEEQLYYSNLDLP